jgi:hypothetical protein
MKEPADIDAEVEEFMIMLADHARKDMIPKMRSSVFCLTVLDGDEPDPYLCLQLGMALLLEKPLIIFAMGNAWVSARVRQLADVVVEGPSLTDPETKERMRAAIREVLRARGLAQ